MNRSLLHVLAIAALGVGCALVLLGGRDERVGRLDAARRRARAGGFVAAAGAAACVLTSTRPVSISLVACLTAGFAALLAGLSGKPRPSGGVAALLWVLAVLVRVLAGR